MAKDIVVSVRPQDRELAEPAISNAIQRFKEESKIDCTLTVNEDLSKDSKGGVVVWGFRSRIKVDNTLDERLRLLEEKMLPEIRTTLYGKNPNRKHET
ncbi:V-ATPase V1 sector subunit E [Puccinia graminis f. sp. tritici]|nr:V-ATPase V1 sector subunit E [Puccinia graminis f. sp. tritici]